ncbi:MAG: urease accessory protein UreF [Sulfurisoma sp.]|nr:urease accessory protein UreF [Sulfurisoma sp.]
MNLPLVRLLQLASPALPVGAYTYSQGLEWAVEAGTVRNEATALVWIGDQLEWNLGRHEAPLLARMIEAWKVGDGDTAMVLNDDYLASRETAELRAETLQMGYSMLRLLKDLRDFPQKRIEQIGVSPAPTFPYVWSYVAATWEIPAADALAAYLWSWAENQVMAALKAVPLGQAAGQRMLQSLGGNIAAVAQRALTLSPDEYSNFAPGFAIASARHETQYSRLFRS